MVRADAAVISTDSLIYGGLVDSRKHNESLTVLMGRENKIKALHSQDPKTPIYAFGTIMRTPYASGSGVEPYYYSKYGNDLYRLSGLQDKMDAGKLSTDEAAELLSLKLSIPSEYLQDWFKRRTKNNTINRMLIRDTKSGIFTYFCEGHDDNSKNSQSALEARYLAVDAKSLAGTGLTVTHVNLLDGTVEGCQCRENQVFSVQYHPESAPGPQDSAYLFGQFIAWMEEGKHAEKN